MTEKTLAFSIRDAYKIVKRSTSNGEKYYGTHCKIMGHSIERCFNAN